jgi:hypothetical protein
MRKNFQVAIGFADAGADLVWAPLGRQLRVAAVAAANATNDSNPIAKRV